MDAEVVVLWRHCGDTFVENVCPHCSEWIDPSIRHIDLSE